MNLALPALVILLGLLPGLACFYGYFGGRFDKRTAGVSGVEELALYVILAIPLDALSVWICSFSGAPLDFAVLTEVVTGTTVPGAAQHISGVFSASYAKATVLYAATLLAGFSVGLLARRIVWAFRVDTWFTYLRVRHEWFYVLQGRVKGDRDVYAYVDVLTQHPDGSRLYQGFVVGFEIGENGGLQSLTLTDAVRGKHRDDKFEWREIPGHRLVIMGSTIHSLNVNYVSAEDRAPAGWLRWMGRVWRSFWFEDP